MNRLAAWCSLTVACLAAVVASDELVGFLAMFIRKCVNYRLPAVPGAPLKPIDPAVGWLVQRWTPRQPRTVPSGPAAAYPGDATDAFWAFDLEMAEATQAYQADQIGKAPQLLDFVQDGHPWPVTTSRQMVTLRFEPAGDGESFTLQPAYLDAVPSMGGGSADGPGRNNGVRWTGLPAGAPLGHAAASAGVTRIEGPVEQRGPAAFRLRFYRGSSFDKPTAWFAATSAGDARYRSAVQQAQMDIPRNTKGADQTIKFDAPPDVPAGTATVGLRATSSAGLPVRFYVRQGPAAVDGDALRLVPIPPRARHPIAVCVVAWQWGNSTVKTAPPVERTFRIIGPPAGAVP